MKKIFKYMLLVISILFLNCSKVLAETKECSSSGAPTICNYKNNDKDYFRINVCYDKDNKVKTIYFLSKIDGKYKQTYFKPDNIKHTSSSKKYDKNDASGKAAGKNEVDFFYISDNAYDKIMKATQDYWDSNLSKTGKTSSYCPTRATQFKDGGAFGNAIGGYLNFCVDSGKYCNAILKNAKNKYNFKLISNAYEGTSQKTLKNKDTQNPEFNLDELLPKIYGSFEYNKVDEVECSDLLGDVSSPNQPAYYLNLAFNIIKYLAIIILIVFTIMDFVKATASKDDDDLNKSAGRFVKRLIYAIIIFVLPTLVMLVMQWGGLVSDSVVCGISEIES